MSCSRFRLRVGRPMVRAGLLVLMLALLLPAILGRTAGRAVHNRSCTARSDPITLDKKILAEAKKNSAIMANLTHLSDMIGPRLTGSAALKQANDWTADKMRSYGLSNVHLEGWTIPVGWERGKASLRIVEPNNGRSLTVAAMGWTPGTKGRVVGEVVVLKARNSADLASYKGKLKNAVILHRAPPSSVPSPSAAPDLTGRAEARQTPRAIRNPMRKQTRTPPRRRERRLSLAGISPRVDGVSPQGRRCRRIDGRRQTARTAQHDRHLARRRPRQRRRTAAEPVRRT